jgi:hypothetical protein
MVYSSLINYGTSTIDNQAATTGLRKKRSEAKQNLINQSDQSTGARPSVIISGGAEK